MHNYSSVAKVLNTSLANQQLMNEFEKKYGMKEDAKTAAFHKSRRMFCIYEDNLVVAESNLPYSHAVWFEKEG